MAYKIPTFASSEGLLHQNRLLMQSQTNLSMSIPSRPRLDDQRHVIRPTFRPAVQSRSNRFPQRSLPGACEPASASAKDYQSPPPPVVNALRGRFFRVNAIVDTVFTIDADRASKTAVYRRLIIRLRSRCLTTDKRTAPVMMNTTADTDHSCTTSPRLVPADGGCSVSRRR